MKLFLDTSVVLSACGSAAGASYHLCTIATAAHWTLVVTPYVMNEVAQNLDKLPDHAAAVFERLRMSFVLMPDVFTVDRPAVFGPAKDRPILFGALAWADVLLTLDRNDFEGLLDQAFYELRVMTPGTFLQQERAAGRIA